MKGWTLPVSTAVLGLLMTALPARAQFLDDREGWPLFSFHRYGGDVNRPATTPDRPYWHGDDAVPLGLRWHDPATAVDDVAVEAPATEVVYGAAASVAVVVSRPRFKPPRHVAHHRRPKVLVARKDCLPVPAKIN